MRKKNRIKGILIISEHEEQRHNQGDPTITSVLQKRLDRINSTTEDESWHIIPLEKNGYSKSVWNESKYWSTDPKDYKGRINIDDIGLVILHINNDGGEAIHFFKNCCQGIPVILTSSAAEPEDWKEFLASFYKGKEIEDRKGVIYLANEDSYIKNFGDWIESWIKEYKASIDDLMKTYDVLTKKSRGEQLVLNSKHIKDSFLDLAMILHSFLVLKGELEDQTDQQKVSKIKSEIDYFSTVDYKKNIDDQLSLDRLFRPASASEESGYYWFDASSPDVNESTIYSDNCDKLLKSILDNVKEKRTFSNPSLSPFHSKESLKEGIAISSLRIVWEILRSHYHNDQNIRDESRKRLPKPWSEDEWLNIASEKEIIELFNKAYSEYLKTKEKMELYLQ